MSYGGGYTEYPGGFQGDPRILAPMAGLLIFSVPPPPDPQSTHSTQLSVPQKYKRVILEGSVHLLAQNQSSSGVGTLTSAPSW